MAIGLLELDLRVLHISTYTVIHLKTRPFFVTYQWLRIMAWLMALLS